MNERYAARRRRRAFRKTVKPSSSGGDRSKFEDDRSKSRGDAEKNAHSPDVSVAVTTES